MKKISIPFRAFLQASALVVYIAMVVGFITYIGNTTSSKNEQLYAPMIALLLFVLSALISGGLVLGKAVQLYLDNKRKPAISLVVWTAGWIFVYLLLFISFVLNSV